MDGGKFMSENTVTYHFRGENLKEKRNAEIWMMRKSGYSNQEIGIFFRISDDTVTKVLNKLTLERQKYELQSETI